MATFQMGILGQNTLPDDTGNVYYDNYGNQATPMAKHGCFVFKNAGTVNYLFGTFIVPQNYNSSGTTKLLILWSCGTTDGDFCWDYETTAIAEGETMADAALDNTDTTGSTDIDTEAGGTYTADDLLITEITITAGDYTAGDIVQFRFGRDYATESSSIADNLILHDLVLQYTN